MKAIIVT